MTEKEIRELYAKGFHHWKVVGMFGKREVPYFCHAKTAEDAMDMFNTVMGKRYCGIKAMRATLDKTNERWYGINGTGIDI